MSYALKRYLDLPAADRAALLAAWVWLARVGVGLRVAPVRWLVPREEEAAAPDVTQEMVRRAEYCARWLDAAARHGFPHARCLHRALALHRWLRAQGMPSELHIGVRKEGGALAAHAWVALGGHVLGDSPDAVNAFTPLARVRGEPNQRACQETTGAPVEAGPGAR